MALSAKRKRELYGPKKEKTERQKRILWLERWIHDDEAYPEQDPKLTRKAWAQRDKFDDELEVLEAAEKGGK